MKWDADDRGGGGTRDWNTRGYTGIDVTEMSEGKESVNIALTRSLSQIVQEKKVKVLSFSNCGKLWLKMRVRLLIVADDVLYRSSITDI